MIERGLGHTNFRVEEGTGTHEFWSHGAAEISRGVRGGMHTGRGAMAHPVRAQRGGVGGAPWAAGEEVAVGSGRERGVRAGRRGDRAAGQAGAKRGPVVV